jgi:hypothetical protein
MTEWSNVLTLKVGVLPSTIGSNPILSEGVNHLCIKPCRFTLVIVMPY